MSKPLYADDYPGDWRIILDGQQDVSQGAHRWEAVNVNGLTVFNNGEDLPATYRVGDKAAIPIYELREAGIAWAGTIGEDNGFLLCGAIGEIQADHLDALLSPLGGAINAAQAGAVNSGATTASMTHGNDTVTATAAIFTDAMVGRYCWCDNGWHKKITALVGGSPTTQVQLEAAPTFDFSGRTFFVVDADADYTVTAVADLFTADMVGRSIMWDNGTTRKITEFVDAKHVKVDMYVAVASGVLWLENPDTYAAYKSDQFVNDIGYKIICGMQDPRRWGPQLPGAIQKGSRLLRLKYPMKSLATGHQIIIVGAGLDGGNHTTTIQRIYGLNTHLVVTTAANGTVTAGKVMRADTVGSTIGAYLLQDDGSRILRIKGCRGELVVYKESSIFLGKYSGLVESPYAFKKLATPKGTTLYYPWTLIEVEGTYHIYAGRDSLYRFDMTNQVPERIPLSELCADLFFSVVAPSQREYVWTADNVPTKEILLVFPTTGSDKGIYFDYKYSTASTTTAAYTAAATVKRPYSNFFDDWFVMGTANGTLLVYGLMQIPWPWWGNQRSIYFRRDANPFGAIYDYTTTLQSGLEDFGDPYNEKDWQAWVLQLASQEAALGPVTVMVDFLGARNASETPTLLGTSLLKHPKTTPLVPVWFSQFYLQDRIKVRGFYPCRVSTRIWEVAGIRSKSFSRREPVS